VADFTGTDTRGGAAADATAKTATDLATNLADILAKELAPVASRLRIEIRAPAQFPAIEGDAPADQAADARGRAKEIDADVVVYGTLATDATSTTLQPRLYLADRIRRGVDELTGDHRLGAPVPLPGNPEDQPWLVGTLVDQLVVRTRALAELTVGLWHYHADQPQQAIQRFERAARMPGWDRRQGKELLYVFLGNAAERQGAQWQRQGRRVAAGRSFDQALRYFQEALAIDSEYARAWYGIAETQFLQLDLDCPIGRTDPGRLAQVVRGLQRAQRATHRPVLADIDTKVAFGLGRAYVCMSLAEVSDRREQAQQQLGQAIQAFEAGDKDTQLRIQQVAAEAYGQLGLLAFAYPDTPDATQRLHQAVPAYRRAIELSQDRPNRLTVFQCNLAAIYERLGQPRAAEAARSQAPQPCEGPAQPAKRA
jgi:tetratricopeptide (TPR) repeat protein